VLLLPQPVRHRLVALEVLRLKLKLEPAAVVEPEAVEAAVEAGLRPLPLRSRLRLWIFG